MSRYVIPGVLLLALVGVGLILGQTTSSPAPALENRVGKVIDVAEANRPAEQCTILKVWRMSDGTPAMQVQSVQTKEMMTVVERPGAASVAERFRLYRWGRAGVPPAGVPVPVPSETIAATPKEKPASKSVAKTSTKPTAAPETVARGLQAPAAEKHAVASIETNKGAVVPAAVSPAKQTETRSSAMRSRTALPPVVQKAETPAPIKLATAAPTATETQPKTVEKRTAGHASDYPATHPAVFSPYVGQPGKATTSVATPSAHQPVKASTTATAQAETPQATLSAYHPAMQASVKASAPPQSPPPQVVMQQYRTSMVILQDPPCPPTPESTPYAPNGSSVAGHPKPESPYGVVGGSTVATKAQPNLPAPETPYAAHGGVPMAKPATPHAAPAVAMNKPAPAARPVAQPAPEPKPLARPAAEPLVEKKPEPVVAKVEPPAAPAPIAPPPPPVVPAVKEEPKSPSVVSKALHFVAPRDPKPARDAAETTGPKLPLRDLPVVKKEPVKPVEESPDPLMNPDRYVRSRKVEEWPLEAPPVLMPAPREPGYIGSFAGANSNEPLPCAPPRHLYNLMWAMKRAGMNVASYDAPAYGPTLAAGHGYVIQAAGSYQEPLSHRQLQAMQNTAILVNVLQNSPVAAQREWAAGRLHVVDPRSHPHVVEVLMRTARQDPAAPVRATAVQSLASMAVYHRPVVATIEAATQDPDAHVRNEAAQAMKQLTGAQ